MALPFNEADRQASMRRNYAHPTARFKSIIPKELRDTLPTASEDDPVYKHGNLIGYMEYNLSKTPDGPDEALLTNFREEARRSGVNEELAIGTYLPAAILGAQTKRAVSQKECRLFGDYIASAQQQHPGLVISGFQMESLASMNEYMEKEFPSGRPVGTGLNMAEYGVASSQKGRRFLGTDNLMDCVSVVLTARDPKKPGSAIAVVSHIDVTTKIPEAIAQLFSEIPKGYKVDSYLLGSSFADAPYMNVEIAHELINSGRISSLSYNVDGPAMLAVDVVTGKVLAAPSCSTKDAAEFPVYMEFNQERDRIHDYHGIAYQQLAKLSEGDVFRASGVLTLAAHPVKPIEKVPAPRTVFDELTTDGVLDQKDLNRLANDVARNLKTSGVRVKASDGWLEITNPNGALEKFSIDKNIRVTANKGESSSR